MKTSSCLADVRFSGCFAKRKLAKGIFALAIAGAVALFGQSARAASASWNIDAAGNWSAAGSWDVNGIPGATSGTNSADIASFGFPLTADRIVTVDANRNIGGITFSNTSAFKFTLSGGSLLLSNGGVIQTGAGDGNHTDTISSAIAIQGIGGSATFTAGATSASSVLSIGAVTGVSTASNVTTLTLNGTNTGANAVTGIVGNGALGGTLAVVKSGSGTWQLTGANTFTGGLTLNSGILAVSTSTSALGAGTLALNGGTLDFNDSGAGLSFSRNTTVGGNAAIISEKNVAGAGVTYTLGTLSIGSYSLAVSGGDVTSGTSGLTFGATTLTGNATFNVTNPGGGGTTLLTLGALNDGGTARTLTKSGSGTLTLATAASSLINGTKLNVASGTLNSNLAAALGTQATVDVADGATFSVGATQTIGGLTNIGSTLNTGSVSIGGGFTLTIGSTANNLTSSFSGVISGATGILTKDGLGTLTLSGANSYGGLTTVSAGVLNIRNATGLGTVAAGTSVTAGAALELQGDIAVGAEALTLNGSGNNGANGGALRNISGNNTFGGLVTLGAASRINSDAGNLSLSNAGIITGATFALTLGGSGNMTIASILGTTTGTLTKDGVGTVTLSGINTYSGTSTLTSGTLIAANAQALGTGGLSLGSVRLDLATDSSINAYNTTAAGAAATIVSDRATAGAGIMHTLGTLSVGGDRLSIQAGSNVTSGTAGVTFGTTTLSANGATFDVGSGASLTLNALAGNFAFWKQGVGTLNLASAAATARTSALAYMSAGTMVLGGTVGTSDALGTGGVKISLSGGTLDLATDTTVLAHEIYLWGNSTILSDRATAGAGITQTLNKLTSYGADTLTIDKGANVTSGTAVVQFNGTVAGTAAATFSVVSGAQLALLSTLSNTGKLVTFTGAGDSSVAGTIDGGGGLTKSGSGNLTLSSNNTYTGATNIGGGIVTLGGITSLGPTATAVLNMTGGTLNLAAVGSTLLSLNGNASSAMSSTGAATLTVNPVANTTSVFAGNIGGGGGTLGVTVNGGGALTLSGTNTYNGTTTLTAGQLNLNSATALGTSALALTTGILDNTSGSAKTLSNNVTLNGNFAFGGSSDLSFGASGTLTNSAAARTVDLMGTSTLTFGTWTNNVATPILTVLAMPGSTSALSIGTYNSASTASISTIAGNGNMRITGGIVPTTAGAGLTYSSAGTLTLSGASTYTGATTFNSGTVILDATGGPASLAASTAPTFAGGTFVFKGDGAGTGQTLGALTLAAGPGSSLQVVGGASGTALTLGTITDSANSGTLNISLSGTTPSVTTTTLGSAWTNGTGARGAVTFTNGGTTSFATLTTSGANNAFSALTIASGLLGSGTNAGTNYILTNAGQTVTATESVNALQLSASTGSQQLTINSGQVLSLTSGGLLNTSTSAFTIAGPGTLNSATATNSDLIIHNFGTGGLTIGAVIANGSGASVVTLDGAGTTTLSGINTYTGATSAGGGAVLSIGANSGLGAVGTGAALTLNNATLQATNTFSLDNAGANIRAITLGAGGGTFDVTGANVLTELGVISGSGSLTKTGTGTLVLSTGVNTYSGGFTNIQNGTLQLGGSAGSIAASNFIVLGSALSSSSGTFVLGDGSNAKSQTVAGLFTQGLGAANAVVGGNASNSTLTFAGSMLTPSSFAGTLGGSSSNQNNLALSVTSGQLALSGSNSFVGGTTLSGGVLNINSATALGAGSLAITSATAVIDNTSGSSVVLANNNNVTTTTGFVFSGSNNLSFGSGSLGVSVTGKTIAVDGASTLTFGGGLVNNVAAGTALTLTVNGSTGTLSLGGYNMQNGSNGGAITNTIAGSGNVNFTGAITNGSFGNANSLTYTGTGILTLSAPNTYAGLTTVNTSGGILKFGAGGSLNGGAGNLTLTAGTLDVGGQNVSLGTFADTSSGLVTSSVAGGSLTASITSSSASMFLGSLSTNLTLASGSAAANISGSFYNVGNGIFNNASASILNLNGSVMNGGNLTLNNNGNAVSGITVSNVVNNAGWILSSGTGTTPGTVATSSATSVGAGVLISATIGSNVTTVTQNSAHTPFELLNANTFTGSATILSGTMILGSATAASSSQILLGDTTGSANTSLLELSGLTVANNILVQAGSTGTSTIGSASSGATSAFSGAITLNKNVILSPYNYSVTYSGPLSGVGGISVASSGLFTDTSGQSYGIGGGTAILSGANTFQGDTSVLAGALQLNGSAIANQDLAAWLGSSTNDVVVGDTTGFQSARLLLNPGVAGQIFSRNITVQAGSGGAIAIGNDSSGYNIAVSGNVKLNSSVYLLDTGFTSVGTTTFSGNLSKGPGAIGATSIFSSGMGFTKLTGVSNNYDGGTVLAGVGVLWASGNGTLGTGNVVAELGTLRLSDTVALASTKMVHVGPNGALSMGSDTSGFAAYLAGVLDNSSSGGILLGTTITTNALNLASFGNGLMALGADQQTSETYSASSLGANSDGNYHLGFGTSSLIISNGVLVGPTAKLIIGSPTAGMGILGNGGVGFENNGYPRLSGANTYGGGTEIFIGSSLRGTQGSVPGNSPFGSATGSMTLHGASLYLSNNGTSAVGTTVGAFAFDGSSFVRVDGVASGNNALTVGEITRNGNGVLSIGTTGTLGSTTFLKTSGTAPATVAAGVAGGGTVQMAAPYYVSGTFDVIANYANNANFMSYDATNGFMPITNAYTTLVGAPNNAIVKLISTATVNADQTIYALALSSPATAFTITNTSGTDRTLTISSGGVNYDTQNGSSLVIGGTTAGTRINLNFGGQEAIFNDTASNGQVLTINGNITNATGITKSGPGVLVLAGTGSDFVGNITLLNAGSGTGFLRLYNDLNLGGVGAALNNGVVLNGGKLLFDTGTSMTLSSNRTVTVGANGGVLESAYSGNFGANAITIDSKITGNSTSYLNVVSAMTGANGNTVASTFTFTNTANDFTAPIFIGSASSSSAMTLTFDTDSQLGNASNSVTLLEGSSVLRFTGTGSISSARGISFLDLGGGLEVSSATGVWTNSGVLSGSGVFNKMGNGKLVLTGDNTQTGSTIVGAGVLNIQNANALGVTTAAISGNSGVSGGGVYVQGGAALELQGNIAISGTGGKTIYVNGSGISNAGALRSVSGSNSNTGAVVLQSDTTIGVDAGVLALSGIVSGTSSLTKVGAGTLVLSGNNTYFGNTTVSVGTLLINGNGSAATGIMSVSSGAVLGGTGALGGAVMVQSGGSLLGGDGTTSSLALTSSSNVTFSAGSHIVLSLGGSLTNSSLARTGGVWSFDTNQSFTFNDFGATTGTYHNLITGLTGTESGLGTIASWTNTNGWTGTFVLNGSSIDLNLIITPEPATWALLTFSLAAMMIFRRRRK